MLLREFLIFLLSFAIYLGPPTSLLLAFPVRMAGKRLLKQTLNFWKILLFVYLVDVVGHQAVLAVRYTLGAYRPPVTLTPLHWIENFIAIAVIAFVGSLVILRSHKNGAGHPGSTAAFSILVALMLLAADAIWYLILSTILMPDVPMPR